MNAAKFLLQETYWMKWLDIVRNNGLNESIFFVGLTRFVKVRAGVGAEVRPEVREEVRANVGENMSK